LKRRQTLLKVLVVEDQSHWQDDFKHSLREVADLIPAFTMDQARQLFYQTSNLAAIVVDTSLTGSANDTCPLVQEIRASGYCGPIIAASVGRNSTHRMIETGCDLECPKRSLDSTLRTVLQLKQVLPESVLDRHVVKRQSRVSSTGNRSRRST
jgi:hypothetical protein